LAVVIVSRELGTEEEQEIKSSKRERKRPINQGCGRLGLTEQGQARKELSSRLKGFVVGKGPRPVRTGEHTRECERHVSLGGGKRRRESDASYKNWGDVKRPWD